MTTLGKSITGVIIIGIIGFGAYYFTQSKTSNMQMEAMTNTQTTGEAMTASSSMTASTSAPAGKKIPFAQFIKQGGVYKCTINENSGTTSSRGTVYVSGDNVKGEILTEAQGRAVTVNFIVSDGFTYTWTSMMPTVGFKFKNNAGGQATGDANAQGNMWNPEQIGDYNCEVTTVDPKSFIPPTTVKFTAY